MLDGRSEEPRPTARKMISSNSDLDEPRRTSVLEGRCAVNTSQDWAGSYFTAASCEPLAARYYMTFRILSDLGMPMRTQ